MPVPRVHRTWAALRRCGGAISPDVAAAVKLLAQLIPDIVTWAAAALRGGRDPEAELRALMLGAEEAARQAEHEKFGD